MTVKELFNGKKCIKVVRGCLHLCKDHLVYNNYADRTLTSIPLDDIDDVGIVFKGTAVCVKTKDDYARTWYFMKEDGDKH